MPKRDNVFKYSTFRVDVSFDDHVMLDRLEKWIKSESMSYLIMKEVSDVVQKEHLQGKIGTKLSVSRLRQKFKEVFPEIHHGMYSIQEVDKPQQYDQYICKGEKHGLWTEWIRTDIFTDDWIDGNHNLYWNVNSELLGFINTKKKRLSAVSFTQKMTKLLQEQHTCVVDKYISLTLEYNKNDYENNELDKIRLEIFGLIMKELGSISKVFDDHVLIKLWNGITNSFIQQSSYDVSSHNENLFKKLNLK